ncbi:glucosaminidase domain-containing protein [Planctomycetota bacterium]
MYALKWVWVTLLLSSLTVLLVSCQSPRCAELRVSYHDMGRPLPVMSCGSAQAHDLVSFFLQTHPKADVSEVSAIAKHYIKEAGIEGVNHDVAFCQMCIETNYLRFGGDVHRGQNNFSGIGATGNGVAGASFKSVQIGVRAHIQHLKAYASRKSLQRGLVDPRFVRVRRGSAPYVEDLSGKWAVDPHYGAKIRRKLQSLGKWL